MGHTMSIHSRNDDVILQFGLKKPAFRIVVNTPTTLGSIGLTTGLDPSMTLGCGGYGGNITSDNISPRHLLNIKRLAYETSPAPAMRAAAAPAAIAALPRAPAPPRVPGGLGGGVAGAADRPVPGVARLHAARAVRGADRRRAQRHRPAATVPAPAPGRAARAAHAARVSKNLPSSCAKTTFGRRCGRGARSSSASERS